MDEQGERPAVKPADELGDWFLWGLVQAAERGLAEARVTLMVGGTLVSGHLVAGSAFLDAVVTAMPTTADLPAVADLRETGFGAKPETQPKYIHLRDVIVWGPVPQEFARWRGRICEIQGFTLEPPANSAGR